jgi:hypothetical protein
MTLQANQFCPALLTQGMSKATFHGNSKLDKCIAEPGDNCCQLTASEQHSLFACQTRHNTLIFCLNRQERTLPPNSPSAPG